jgi:hypothetical protein
MRTAKLTLAGWVERIIWKTGENMPSLPFRHLILFDLFIFIVAWVGTCQRSFSASQEPKFDLLRRQAEKQQLSLPRQDLAIILPDLDDMIRIKKKRKTLQLRVLPE